MTTVLEQYLTEGPLTAAKLNKLRTRLNVHRILYYVLDDPAVTDQQFDTWEREVKALERAHPEFADPKSPTRTVGSSHVDAYSREDVFLALRIRDYHREHHVTVAEIDDGGGTGAEPATES